MAETLPPEPSRLDQIVAHGYAVADPDYAPQPSNKHGFAKLERDGQFYLGKYSRDDTQRQRSIEADVWWCNTIASIVSEQPLAIHAPRIIDHDTGWYVAEWIEGELSACRNSSPNVLIQLIPTYATYLAQLDRVDPARLAPPPGPHYELRQHLEEDAWEDWTAPALAQGFLTSEQIRAAHQVVDDFQDLLTPRMQHGDFVPWHILIDKQQTWWLVDGEHASPNKPRYFDLAYMYSRIFTYMHGPAEAAQLLQTYSEIAHQTPGDIYPALLPVMASRAIGMHFDAAIDLRTRANDYRAEAQDLLARCLSRDPEQLFQ